MKILKCLFVISLMVFPQASFADESEMVCVINVDNMYVQMLSDVLSKQGCGKGDMLLINSDNKSPYLSRIAAGVCDLERGFINTPKNILCHYIGFVRKNAYK